MTTSELHTKERIVQSLRAFVNGRLFDNARALFDTLGYRSSKRLDLSPNTSQNFVASYHERYVPDADKAMLAQWRSADLLFQLTDSEIKQAWQLNMVFDSSARVNDAIYQSYVFMAIELSRDEYTRTQLATVTREINRMFPMPVMVLFRHGSMLTLSVIDRRLNLIDDQKDVLKKVTLVKDIRYSQPHRAHVEILFDLSLTELRENHSFANFVQLHEAWRKTLDISELNKKFFREIANWYFWAKQKVVFPERAGEDKEQRNATSVIRLLTRVIFVWFLKEKNLLHEELFDDSKLKELLVDLGPKQSTFYKAILQNLFFATLNTEMNIPGKPANRKFRGDSRTGGRDQNYMIHNLYRYRDDFRQPAEFLQLCVNVPFLNGGLFECLDKSEEDRVDGFSDRPENPLSVPNELFFGAERDIDLNDIFGTRNKRYKVQGLIGTFNRYKFTVAENTPIEEEVALDPELLGKVFENLLAAYNPETGVTARKQTGSFYTPREIVNYMVDESLVAYLEARLHGEPLLTEEVSDSSSLHSRLRHLLAYNDESPKFSEHAIVLLIEAIDSLKILDPACGSGAFPLGILHKLVFILRKLDPHNQRWQQAQINKAAEFSDSTVRERAIADIEEAFARNELDYGRKLYLIENSIYGVDIQPIAVQITKLRCFISLIVDEKADDGRENRGILPLPNLETKFVAANSLIGVKRPSQQTLRNTGIDEKENELAQVRRELFTARTTQTKRKYRDLDKKIRDEIRGLLLQDGFSRETTEKLARWDPYDHNTAATFFDSEWMFDLRTGFDIVIGNPPYLESRHPGFNDELKDQLQVAIRDRWGESARLITRGSDLLVYFFETSLFNIKNSGHVVLITQNSWLDTEYGKKFQKFLLEKTQVERIVDSDYKYFDSNEGPNINTVISIFRGKTASPDNVLTFARFHENFQDLPLSVFNLNGSEDTDQVETHRYQYTDPALHEIKWGVLLSAEDEVLRLLELLTRGGLPLNKIDGHRISIGQGLNLTKDFVVDKTILDRYGFTHHAKIPFMTSSDGALFVVQSTKHFLLDQTKLSKIENEKLRKDGIRTFDPRSTSKVYPALIMPRGVYRHHCALNLAKCYSASSVEIYDLAENRSEKVIRNLWLFLNSSVGWLLREINGRKNLGGGLLKAEAADLEPLPIYMDFNASDEIGSIIAGLRTRKVLDTAHEVETPEHHTIDRIVFRHLGLDKEQSQRIVDILKAKVVARINKSQT